MEGATICQKYNLQISKILKTSQNQPIKFDRLLKHAEYTFHQKKV